MRRLVRTGRPPAVCRPVPARRLLSQRRNAVTVVFDNMQAPVPMLGTRRWQAPVIQSRVRYTGDIPVRHRCPGWYVVPSPGRPARSRDIRSKQEDPIRFRTLIDSGKPELYGRQQPFRRS